MQSEIEKTVRKISKDRDILGVDLEQQQRIEIDGKGMKKYLDFVIREEILFLLAYDAELFTVFDQALSLFSSFLALIA